jgi:hypothetical protein
MKKEGLKKERTSWCHERIPSQSLLGFSFIHLPLPSSLSENLVISFLPDRQAHLVRWHKPREGTHKDKATQLPGKLCVLHLCKLFCLEGIFVYTYNPRQDYEFESSVGYRTIHCLKNKIKNKTLFVKNILFCHLIDKPKLESQSPKWKFLPRLKGFMI